jgi:hypothetical protein
MGKMTLDMDAIKVTTFETAATEASNSAAVTLATTLQCCGTGCNTKLTCSSALC